MTELLHMKDVESQYVRHFEGRVLKAHEDWVLLDRTAFYPEGGGQPSDRGVIRWEGAEARVDHVSKKGAVKHRVAGALPPEGAVVSGDIDWDLRFRHMKMHTSQHVISGVVFSLFGAQTAGNQIHADETRIDFARAFTEGEVKRLEEAVNEVLSKTVPVITYEEDRDAVYERLVDKSRLKLVPESVRRLRVVEVKGVDLCPCAGTHVRDVSEIGRMEIVRRESKGADRDRITYRLSQGEG
ncbi:MAG: alanyl-tRNA editing protein [Methanobacteriota archaeon]